MNWTKEPWVAHGGKYFHGWKGHIYAKDGKTINDATHVASVHPRKPDRPFLDDLEPIAWEREQQPTVEANARRICDAVNFTAGQDLSAAIEAGVSLGDVVEALAGAAHALEITADYVAEHNPGHKATAFGIRSDALKARALLSLFKKEESNG